MTSFTKFFAAVVLVLGFLPTAGCARGVPPAMAWDDHDNVKYLMDRSEAQQQEIVALKAQITDLHKMVLELAGVDHVRLEDAQKRLDALEAQLNELESKSPPNPLQGRK